MENYKHLNTKKFHNTSNDPLSLVEYKMFEDVENELNFTILKMQNNTNNQLLKMTIKIKELDNKGHAIKEKQYELSNLNIDSLKQFVLVNKFVLDDETKAIKVSIIDSILEPIIEEESIDPKPKKIIVKRRMYPFMVSIVLTTLVTFLMAFNFFGYYKDYTKNRQIFSYTELGNNEIAITEYHGLNSDVTIPNVFNNKKVVKISSNTFKDSAIENIIINSETIEIDDNAFRNAYKLKSVRGVKATRIGRRAFSNAQKLKTFEFEEVEVIANRAFYNTKALRSIDISNMENTNFEFGSLDNTYLNNYVETEGLIILNKILITTSNNLDYVVLDKSANIEAISNYAFANSGSTLRHIEIYIEDIYIDKNMFKGLNSIETIILNSNVEVSDEVFYYLPNWLRYIEMPLIGDNLSQLFGTDLFYIEAIYINNVPSIPDSYKTGNFVVESWMPNWNSTKWKKKLFLVIMKLKQS